MEISKEFVAGLNIQEINNVDYIKREFLNPFKDESSNSKLYNSIGKKLFCKHAGLKQFPLCKKWEFDENVSFGISDETCEEKDRNKAVKKLLKSQIIVILFDQLSIYAGQWRRSVYLKRYDHDVIFNEIILFFKKWFKTNPYELYNLTKDYYYKKSCNTKARWSWERDEKGLDYIVNRNCICYNDNNCDNWSFRMFFKDWYANLKGQIKNGPNINTWQPKMRY